MKKQVVIQFCLSSEQCLAAKLILNSAADVNMEIPVLIWSLKSSMLSSTSFQMGTTFLGVRSAAVEQSRRKANIPTKCFTFLWHEKFVNQSLRESNNVDQSFRESNTTEHNTKTIVFRLNPNLNWLSVKQACTKKWNIWSGMGDQGDGKIRPPEFFRTKTHKPVLYNCNHKAWSRA